ncbi:MAG: (d)CMP kinase [Terriglobia bacterium]
MSSNPKAGLIVAIDGPSGAGKSTVAKRVAKELGYLYIDTGAMYRAVGLKALRLNERLDDPEQIVDVAKNAKITLKGSTDDYHVFLDDQEVTLSIRDEAVSQAASKVSAISGVRKVLVQAQREMGKAGAVVLEGRDIGTKVFPNADLKVFLDASEPTRAERRYRENQQRGVRVTLEETLVDIKLRDARDSQRSDSPLVRAEGARDLDTSSKTIEEVVQEILGWVEEIAKQKGHS